MPSQCTLGENSPSSETGDVLSKAVYDLFIEWAKTQSKHLILAQERRFGEPYAPHSCKLNQGYQLTYLYL